jgi:hypothetical protein
MLMQRGALTSGQPIRELISGHDGALMGYTPMLEAARWGNQELVQLLHNNGVTLNYEAFACCVGACGERATIGYLPRALNMSWSLLITGMSWSIDMVARVLCKDAPQRSPLSLLVFCL